MKIIKRQFMMFGLINLILLLSIFFNCKDSDNTYEVEYPLIEDLQLDFNNKAGENYFLIAADDIKVTLSKNILLLDSEQHKVFIFSPDLKLKNVFGEFGQGPGEFLNPTRIQTDLNGSIYVLDIGNNRIEKFDSTGAYLNSVRRNSKDHIGLDLASFDISSAGDIYISSINEKLVSVLNQNGDIVDEFGDRLYKKDRLNINLNRTIIKIDSKDNIYVTFIEEPIVRKYDNTWNLIWETDLRKLDEIKNSNKRRNKKRKQYLREGRLNNSITISHDMDVVDNQIYLQSCGDYGTAIYVLNSVNGEVMKVFRFNKKRVGEFTENEERIIIWRFSYFHSNMFIAQSWFPQKTMLFKTH